MIAKMLEQRVRDIWAHGERDNPQQTGLIYALLPVPSHFTLADIPNIPECVHIEVEHMEFGSDGDISAVGLKFIKRAGV